MTREEAIKILEYTLECVDEETPKGASEAEAIPMAIDALKRVSFENDTEIKSCSKDSDLISRTEAIDAIIETLDAIDHVPKWVFDKLTCAINILPSADRPRGEWISKEELIDAINDAQFVYDGNEGERKEHDISELVRVMFKDIIDNLSSADMRGDTK